MSTENHTTQVHYDTNLIAQLCLKDEKSLELLYKRYYPKLFRFIGRLAQQQTMIDEIINDVMYAVWDKAVTYNGQCKPSTWIFSIAYNKTLQALRDNKHSYEESLDLIEEDNAVLGRADVGLKQLEMDNWLESAFAQLSPEQRAVIELTYFQGLAYSELLN